jgi:hypothetical protein
MWTDPNGTTPSIVQIDFEPWGQDLPGDAYAYCGPTSMVIGLYYLYARGFTQLAPGPFVSQDDSATVNLERIIAGLCRTSREARWPTQAASRWRKLPRPGAVRTLRAHCAIGYREAGRRPLGWRRLSQRKRQFLAKSALT